MRERSRWLVEAIDRAKRRALTRGGLEPLDGDEPPERLLTQLGRTPAMSEDELDAWAHEHGNRKPSRRELDVLVCASHGLSASETGAVLGIGEETVKEHLAHARTKLQAKTTTEAACSAIRQGLIS